MLPHEIAFFVLVCVCALMMLLLVQAYKLVTINNLTKKNTIIAESSGEEVTFSVSLWKCMHTSERANSRGFSYGLPLLVDLRSPLGGL